MTAPLSVVIPTLNEAAALPATLQRVREAWPQAEIVVTDGGSEDATIAVARAVGARVVTGPGGRGGQLRRGAECSSGDWLLFLHADTLLPANASAVVGEFMQKHPTGVATFRLRFDRANWFLRVSGWFTRFDSVWTRFGDQGIVVSRPVYEGLGGMPEWPLFEDVEFLCRARRRAPIVSLDAAVVTSSRRFTRYGPVRQQLRNGWLVWRYLQGESPDRLAGKYSPPQADEHHPATRR